MLTTLALVALPPVAVAEVRVGSLATIAPVQETASLGGWCAGDFGPVYLGGEIAIETIDLIEGDVGISYHVLVGHRHALSKRVHLMFDGGLGVTQMDEIQIGVFGSKGGSDTVAVVPSGAVRAQLAFELGHLAGAAFAIGVGSEARGAVASNDSAGGIAVGLAVVVSGASEGR